MKLNVRQNMLGGFEVIDLETDAVLGTADSPDEAVRFLAGLLESAGKGEDKRDLLDALLGT